MGIKKLEPVSTEEERGPLLTTQAIEVQVKISQTTLRPNGLSLPEEKDIAMKETSEMTVIDPSLGFPGFLTGFDSLEFNSLLVSHFHHFGPPYANFLRFSMPAEGQPLLEGLFKVHRDFTSGFRGGAFDSLFKERLLEWRGRGVVQDLMEAKFKLSFLLEYLWSITHPLFQRKITKDLDVEITTAKEALARSHKVLEDLKTRKRQALSSSASSSTPAVP